MNMNFNRLLSLITENDEFKLEHPRPDKWYRTFDAFHPNANKKEETNYEFMEYDDWTNYLDYEDNLSIQELSEFISHFNLTPIYYFKGKYLNLKDKKHSYWLKKEDDLYELISTSNDDMEQDINNISMKEKLSTMGIDENDVYIGGWECTIGDMKEYGGKVYHYTTEEKLQLIKKSRELRPSYGTGLTNRHANGIFASVSPETYANGSYGNVLLEIDLTEFKNKEGIEELRVEPEPDVLDNAVNEAFAHKLGFTNYNNYVSSDMSEETIIIGHSIPIRYIKHKI